MTLRESCQFLTLSASWRIEFCTDLVLRFTMKCINCGISIPDFKRMCDECAAQMVSDLINDKEEESTEGEKENILPADLPKGVVISWDPARKSGEVRPAKTSPKTG